MKTLQECKNETVKAFGYDDWSHFVTECRSVLSMESMYDDAIKMFQTPSPEGVRSAEKWLLDNNLGNMVLNQKPPYYYASDAMHDFHNQFDQDKWVSVSERMPEAGRRVIVEGGIGYHMSGLWYSIMDEGNKNPLPIQWTVNYWQPLPNPTKTTNNG